MHEHQEQSALDQGIYYFMSLHTGKKLTRRNFTPLPMPKEVINCVNVMGQAEGQPNLMMCYDWKGWHIGQQNLNTAKQGGDLQPAPGVLPDTEQVIEEAAEPEPKPKPMLELGKPGDQVKIEVEEDTSQNENDVVEENAEVLGQEPEVPDGTKEENWQEQTKEEEIEVETIDEDEPGAMLCQSGWVHTQVQWLIPLFEE
jgi:hypothetical protein